MNVDTLYSFLLQLHAILPYKFGSGFAFPLLKLTLELTYGCNLRCSFCFQKEQKKLKKSDELTTNEYINVINQIPKFTLITFTGGEPLLRKDSYEIIKYALNSNKCNIITNGVLLTDMHIQSFVDRKLLLLGVSIDGIDQYHDQFRGMQGAFNKVKNNLQLLQKYKKSKKVKYPFIDVKTLITKENVNMLEDIYHFAVDLGADFFTLSFMKASNIQFHTNFIKGLDDEKLYTNLPIDLYVDKTTLYNKISKILVKSKKGKTKIRFYPKITGIKDIENNFNNSKQLVERFKPCLEPWSGMQISPTGDAYPCLAYKVGNIRESSLFSIWNSEKFKEFRKTIKNLGLFPGCVGCCYLKYK